MMPIDRPVRYRARKTVSARDTALPPAPALLGKVLRKPDHHRQRVLGHALRIGARRVHHLDASGRRGRHVHVVVADAMSPDDLQTGPRVEQRGIHFPGRSQDQGVRLGDLPVQDLGSSDEAIRTTPASCSGPIPASFIVVIIKISGRSHESPVPTGQPSGLTFEE